MADNIPNPLTTPTKPSKGPKPFIGPTAPPSARTPGAQVPGFNPRQGPSAPDRANNPNRVASVIGKVGDYLGNVARSARDVPTAFGTHLDLASGANNAWQTSKAEAAAGKPSTWVQRGLRSGANLATQIGQVGQSIAGKKDTSRSDQYFGKNNIYLKVNDSTGSWSKLEDGPRRGYEKPGVAKSRIARTPGAKEQEQIK
jgi:hypothetical protein